MVRSTDVEEPAPLAAAAARAGDAGCCRTGVEDGDILNVNYCDVCLANLTFYCVFFFFLQAEGLLWWGGGGCDCSKL